MVLQGFARPSQENAMFFDTFDVPAEALWNPASDPRSPSPWAPCYQEAMLFLSQPFLLAFRCGGVTNKRGGAGRPQARSALIIEEGGPSNASCWFSQALLFFVARHQFCSCSLHFQSALVNEQLQHRTAMARLAISTAIVRARVGQNRDLIGTIPVHFWTKWFVNRWW